MPRLDRHGRERERTGPVAATASGWVQPGTARRLRHRHHAVITETTRKALSGRAPSEVQSSKTSDPATSRCLARSQQPMRCQAPQALRQCAELLWHDRFVEMCDGCAHTDRWSSLDPAKNSSAPTEHRRRPPGRLRILVLIPEGASPPRTSEEGARSDERHASDSLRSCTWRPPRVSESTEAPRTQGPPPFTSGLSESHACVCSILSRGKEQPPGSRLDRRAGLRAPTVRASGPWPHTQPSESSA